MRNRLSKILVPALIVGIAAVQSFGIDRGRFLHIGIPAADSLTMALSDSITTIDSSKADGSIATDDSIATIDSIAAKDTVATTDSIAAADSLTARDTIVAPDSLKDIDPLRYKYFVELKDSLTRATTRDSLLSAGDTLELALLDSLYLKDSTDIAKAKFDAWFNSLTRKEKKKYIAEQELPIKMAEMRAKMERKDSIKAVKDSITQNTPRILETYAVPDSMQYKRLLMWNHDRYFNELKLQTQDTSYNYHFRDLPYAKEDINANWLGVSGSAVQYFDWFKREGEENVIFYTPYRSYTYSPETLPFYNTKTPYTELAYWGTLFAQDEKEEANIKILTTQNILPGLNVTLEYHRFGGKGMLQREDTDNRTAVVSANYMGKRYLMHLAYIYNKVKKSENGGIADNFWIRDTTVDAKEITVNLLDASSKTKKNTVFLDQSYRFPFSFIGRNGTKEERKEFKIRRDSIMSSGDSAAIAEFLLEQKQKKDASKDSVNRDITSTFIGHSSEYSVFTRTYSDNITNDTERNFFNNNFYLNPRSSADSMRVMKMENRVYLRLQPWKADGIISKIDVGIADKLLNYYSFNPSTGFLARSANTVRNSVYLYAGAQGQYKKYLDWHAFGKYTFLGHEINDFGVNADVSVKFYPFRRDRNSPLILKAAFETKLEEPDFYETHFFSNHYRWNNDFAKVSTTKVEASVSIPRWKLEAAFGYSLLGNNIYFDALSNPCQNTTAMSVMRASLMKNFTVGKILHLDHRLMFQVSSNEAVLPLPMFSANLRYYIQFNVVRKVMQMQIGADARYNTLWYAQGYNPVLGVFYNQDKERYGNNADIDVFVNIQWKRACIFIKVLNVGQGWPNKEAGYFSAHNHIYSQRAIKVGIFWPFYIQAGKNSRIGGGNAGGKPSGGAMGGSAMGGGGLSTYDR